MLQILFIIWLFTSGWTSIIRWPVEALLDVERELVVENTTLVWHLRDVESMNVQVLKDKEDAERILALEQSSWDAD